MKIDGAPVPREHAIQHEGVKMNVEIEGAAEPHAKEVNVARRRFQKGQLFKSGKRRKVWVGRWREDV